MERFYDVDNGSVEIDGIDIKEYNLKWLLLLYYIFIIIIFLNKRSLRKHIGYISQEPVLFATTIKENLLYAKESKFYL